jgi:hypothetical protein
MKNKASSDSLKPLSEIEKKSEELSLKYGVKVTPLIFGPEEDRVVGYLKEMPRIAKVRVMDKMLTEPFTACEQLLESCLIKEESDPRIMSEDKHYMGALNEISNMVQVSMNQFKKK